MACQALGRCRICARKHKIAVFGSEETQHFFIEKANLKLIILNTVCIDCIGKIERFVKKMDLDMVFNDYIKEERREVKSKMESTDCSDNLVDKNARELENRKAIRNEGSNEKAGDNSPVAMDLDQTVVHLKKISTEVETSIATRPNGCTSSCSDVGKKTDAQARLLCTGDSQSAASPLRRSPKNQIQQKTSEKTELANEPRRKRPRNISKTHPAAEELGQNIPSVVRTSSPTIAFADCGPIDCAPTGKKVGGRFLWCDFCKKEFTHAGDLNKHRRKHTGEKPYECIQCQRKFAHASNLARHQRVHSGERPFSCTTCARTFTRKDKLAIHTSAGKCEINTTDKDSSQSTFLKNPAQS